METSRRGKVRASWRAIAVAMCGLTAAAGCTGPAEQEESSQAVAWDPDFLKATEIVGSVSSYFGYAKLVYDWYMWASGQSGQAARDLRNELTSIHFEIAGLEDKVRKLDQFVERELVNTKITLISNERTAVQDALKYVGMTAYSPAAEIHARIAADILTHDDYYNMPTQRGLRFDPRLASVSFVEAVTAWLALHAFNNGPRDEDFRQSMREYANHLENVARRTRAAVHCGRGCAVIEVPGRCPPSRFDPDNPPEECPSRLVGSGYSYCSDAIAMKTDNGVAPKPLFCPAGGGDWEEPLPALAREVVESRYAPQKFEETVAQFRRIAND
jgi:hypothetical protein